MKKAVTIILIFTILIVFAGCTNTNEQDDRIEILESQVTSLSNDLNYLVDYLNQLQDEAEQIETEEPKMNYYTNVVVFTLEVSADTYKSLSLGASYETVVSIIGDYGIIEADVSANDTEIKTFKWTAEPISSSPGFEYIYCKFEDDELVEKWSDINFEITPSTNSRPFSVGDTVIVTKGIYDKIEIGSSYETVYSLIGGYGVLESIIEGEKLIETVTWNAHIFGHIYCKFEDDVLTDKWYDDMTFF